MVRFVDGSVVRMSSLGWMSPIGIEGLAKGAVTVRVTDLGIFDLVKFTLQER